MNQEMTNRSDKTNIPERRFDAGAVTATIWTNQGTRRDGTTMTFSTVSLQRRYQDNQGNWKHANTLRLNDLPKAALALNKAYEYLTLRDDNTNAQV